MIAYDWSRVFSFSQAHRKMSRLFMDMDKMDAMDVMDTNGHVFMVQNGHTYSR